MTPVYLWPESTIWTAYTAWATVCAIVITYALYRVWRNR